MVPHVKPERRVFEDFKKQNDFLTQAMTPEGQAQMKAWSSNPSPPNGGDGHPGSEGPAVPANLRTREGFNRATVKEVHAFYATGGTKAQLETYWAEKRP